MRQVLEVIVLLGVEEHVCPALLGLAGDALDLYIIKAGGFHGHR